MAVFSRLDNKGFNLIKVSPVLFHPIRMIIMKTLYNHGQADFRQLRNNIPKITDGNLASNLKALKSSGFIEVYKDIIKNKMRTSYEITTEGRKKFEEFELYLKEYLENRGVTCYE